MDVLVSKSDIARLAGCTGETVVAWERRGRIPQATRIGNRRDRVWRLVDVQPAIDRYVTGLPPERVATACTPA